MVLNKANAQSQSHTKKYHAPPTDLYFWEYLPPGYHQDPQVKFPLIIFFHGIGERSRNPSPDYFAELDKVAKFGPPKEINENIASNDSVMCFKINGVKECFIVLSPQLPEPNISWSLHFPERIVRYAINNLKVDTTRIYLTGLSVGGIAVFQYAQNTTTPPKFFSEKIAAIAPIAGKGEPSTACLMASRDIAVWAFHGQNDTGWQTPVSNVQAVINQLNDCTNPAADPPGYLTIFPAMGHEQGVWNRAYEIDNTYFSPNVYEWFLQNVKGGISTSPNQFPIVSAGNDTTARMPPNSATLVGTASDPDGSIVSFAWTKQSGPSATLSGTDQPTLNITDMVEGTYVFRFTVTDDDGASSFDEVSLTVETNPVEGSWLTLFSNSAPGRRIELHADERKDNSMQVIGIRTSGNNYLQMYLKTLSGIPNWNNLLAGLTVKWETKYVPMARYQQETDSEGWTRFQIPLDSFRHTTNPWVFGGVSNVALKILPGFGSGNITFGVDEIHFTGGTEPYIWYGDDRDSYASSTNVFTSDSVAFRISDRPVSGGIILPGGNNNNTVAMLQEIKQPAIAEHQTSVEIFDDRYQSLKTVTYSEEQSTDVDLRALVPAKGLYLFKIIKASGEVETKRILFE